LKGVTGVGKGKWTVSVLREPNYTTYFQYIGGKAECTMLYLMVL
jgi:hypothetical protein